MLSKIRGLRRNTFLADVGAAVLGGKADNFVGKWIQLYKERDRG